MQNTSLLKNNKKVIRAWVMYDWSNSVFQLTILSAIFPVYYNQVTTKGTDCTVDFFGFSVINTVLYSWTIAAAYLVNALSSPIFSGIADYTGRRRLFMQIFTWLGAISCGLLYFFDANHIEFGIIAFWLATIGYGGSLVFYNSFLPVIADSKDHDRISAQGYSMGYLGGVLLLLINLVFVLFPGFFGIHDPLFPARLSFLSVFIWWASFSQITFYHLPKYTYGSPGQGHFITKGYLELKNVFYQLLRSWKLRLYLAGFFFMTMGILTVMFMAAVYGEKELGLSTEILIGTILSIQLVGMLGAWLFYKISGRIGNLPALIIAVGAWVLIIFGVYFVKGATGFITVAVFVGLVMGGSQALARSTYARMLPATTDHTSFFSFYDVMEKLATVGGTFSFGLIEAITGNMRSSVLAIICYFILGMVFLVWVHRLDRQR